MTFSKNVNIDLADSLKGAQGINKSLNREPYLGLPLTFGRNRSRKFRGLIKRV